MHRLGVFIKLGQIPLKIVDASRENLGFRLFTDEGVTKLEHFMTQCREYGRVDRIDRIRVLALDHV